MSLIGAIDYPNRIQDRYALLKIREIIDHLNVVKPAVAQNTNSVQQLTTQLQQLTQNITNNVTNTGGGGGTPGTAFPWSLVGLHQDRLTLFQPVHLGQLFFETDRSVFYVTETVAGSLAWRYAGGVYADLRANFPSDLGSNDAGFMFYLNDYAHLARWDGGGWRLTDGGGGYFIDSAINLGTGWQVCDGTVTDYVINNTGNLAVASFTTPNEVGLRVHHRSAVAGYTGAVNAVTLPTFTGTAANTGNESATQTVAAGAGATVPASPHTHTVTPAGTIALPGDPVATLDVLKYFRR